MKKTGRNDREAQAAVAKAQVLQLVQSQHFAAAQQCCQQLCQEHPADAEAWFLLGAIHGQTAEFAQAADCLRRAIALQPQAAAAHYNLGVALNRLQDSDGALVALREAVRLQPAMAEAYLELGNVQQVQGHFDAAVASYRKALLLQPAAVNARCNLAQAYRAQGKLAEAINELSQAVSSYPQHVDARLALAGALQQAQRFQEAADNYREALRIQPDQTAVHAQLGSLLLMLGDNVGAEQQYRHAVHLSQGAPEHHFNLGNALLAQERLPEAKQEFEQALRLRPEFAAVCSNLGLLAQRENRFDEARDWYGRALTIDPGQREAWLNLAKLEREQLRLAEALTALERAVRIAPEVPDAHWERALTWLQMGNFAQGWDEYEWRWQGGEGIVSRPFELPRWEGGPLTGKTILIYAEQGIGDEIMFAGCFAEIISRAGHVVIDCAARLAPLFRRSFPEASVHGGPQDDAPRWMADFPIMDLQIPAGSLPRYLRREPTQFPVRQGYLIADPAQVDRWRERYAQLGAGLKIGISWRGGHVTQVAQKRSTLLNQWRGLLSITGVHWVNLQYGDCAGELRQLCEESGLILHDWEDADSLADLDGFAAQIAALDLVISIDNTSVHMAGALGVPVWALQPYCPDWRWLPEHPGSHWYSGLRQFRQPSSGDWETVFSRACGSLQDELAARNGI